MQEKRKDLKGVKQRKILQALIERLSHDSPELYYQSTSEIAIHLAQVIAQPTGVSQQEKEILAGLTHIDIQMILSLH